MSFFDEYFDRVFIINLDRRTDRWTHCFQQLTSAGITNFVRFSGYENIVYNGAVNGNWGCTSSHRAILELIAYHRWQRTLVLEDDFEIVVPDVDNHLRRVIPEVPEDWDMLYLGGHYGERPRERVTKNVIRINRMLTTSSYAITWRQARKMAPYICGVGPIDSLYGKWNTEDKCYILQPRLMVQYTNWSDLQDRTMDNSQCMMDKSHEAMV